MPCVPSAKNFYPRPPRGGRRPVGIICPSGEGFLSTPSARRATLKKHGESSSIDRFLSTPSARRATQKQRRQRRQNSISIHALREEGDVEAVDFCFTEKISIHALREEGDAPQSVQEQRKRYFYPRPPRGGRLHDCMVNLIYHRQFLSTPSARRATAEPKQLCKLVDLFLSTPSARRATACAVIMIYYDEISIHALREEGDSKNRDKISIFL